MPGSAHHFWTGDRNGELLEQPPWKFEGPACFVLNTQLPGSVPFYRFYSPKDGIHFWTGDPNGELLPKPPFYREGPACFVYPSEQPGTIPLYRFYGNEAGHFWTCDPNGELLPKPPFYREGPACFVLSAPDPGNPSIVPFYRFFEAGWSSPIINSIQPTHGKVGSEIKIFGQLLSPVTEVLCNYNKFDFTVISDTEISAIVPAWSFGTLQDGPITVKTPGSRATSIQAFHVDLSESPTSNPGFSIRTIPENPKIIQPVTVCLMCENYNSIFPSRTVNVIMNFDGSSSWQYNVPTMPPGGSLSFPRDFGLLAEGPHDVFAYVDGFQVAWLHFNVKF